MPLVDFALNKFALYNRGCRRALEFCLANELPPPIVEAVPRSKWVVNACAYYRPAHIRVCLEECGSPAPAEMGRNWTWPGSTTDREPYGVVCHELGHHCDWMKGEKRGTYWSEYSQWVMETSGEEPLTSYAATNPPEWFAEAMRLFITNHALLELVRPKTHELLLKDWKPVSSNNWKAELGPRVPPRVLASLEKKFR